MEMHFRPEKYGLLQSPLAGGVEPSWCDGDSRQSKSCLLSLRNGVVIQAIVAEATISNYRSRLRRAGRLRGLIRGASRAVMVENRRAGVFTQRSRRHMELIENSLMEQRLVAKALPWLRVICATPFQKRHGGRRSERFFCCVCKRLR
jgi:hypothetical protein